MNLSSQRVCLVLGGKGFVGSAIVTEAQRRGYRAVIGDKDEYANVVGTSCDLLINANGNSRKFLATQDPRQEFELSVLSVMRSLHDFTTPLYIHLSSMDVYTPHVHQPHDNPEMRLMDFTAQTPYGFHKYMAEQLVRYYASNWLIFRMAGFVGPGLWKNSIFDLLHGKPLRVHPDSEYQYLDTRDLARMLFEIIDQNLHREIFNIAGDGTIKLREVAAMIPGCRLEEQWNTLPRERYEMNIDKIKRQIPVPSTRETVFAFIQRELAGGGGVP
jgi:nucleoside-diphosphate-sugar epimerase